MNELLGPTHGLGIDPALLAPLATAMHGALSTVFIVVAGVGVAFAIAGFAFPAVEVKPEGARAANVESA